MKRLIGYVRVSRVAGREGESFISPEVQRERIEALAAAHGHAIVVWETDLDQSGGMWARPGFQAALEAVERGEADGIAVARLNRFARSVADAARAVKRLEAVDGILVAADLNTDTSTSTGRLMRNVLMSLAEFELEQIGENWAVAGAKFARRGGHVCKVAPLGYRKREDKRLEPDPETAPIVTELFQRRAAGASWSELCGWLDEELPRPSGRKWMRSSVRGIIERRTYLGEARGGGIVTRDAHLPLVTRGEFEAAQIAEVDGRHNGRRPDGGALLAGIIRCDSCGHTMTRISDGARGYAYYKCRKRNGDGICAAPVGISQRKADPYVEEMFLRQADLAVKSEPADDTVGRAVAALDAAERELSEYQSLNLVTEVGREEFMRQVQARQGTVDDARRALAAVSTPDPLTEIKNVRDLWPDLTTREQRHLLAALLDQAVVSPAPGTGRGTPVEERVRLVWK
jgi:site-specific DNA recombinase